MSLKMICLGRLEIYIALLKSQPVHVRILPHRRLLRLHRWSINKMKIKKTQTPSKSSKKLNELNDFLLFC